MYKPRLSYFSQTENLMIRRSLLPVLLAFSLVFHFCGKNPTAPELVPGRRDYIWELDTLDMPVNYIASVWGASPDDVWAVGAGGTQNDRLLHYDGTKWSTYTNETIWCTGNTLFGFSADDVWMGGGAGWLAHGAGIWHYGGVKWSQHYVYDVEDSYDADVQDIWGTAPNDIYASGVISFYDGQTDDFRGFVLHFDGKRWQEVVGVGPINSQFLTVRKEGNTAYLFSAASFHIHEFYELNGNKLTRIYSGQDANSLYTINERVYFLIDHDIYSYVNGELVKHLCQLMMTISDTGFVEETKWIFSSR